MIRPEYYLFLDRLFEQLTQQNKEMNNEANHNQRTGTEGVVQSEGLPEDADRQ